MGRRFELERSAWIDAPPTVVYEQVVDLRRWRSWMPWEGMDPSIERAYHGPSRGLGARSSWSGGRMSSVGHVEIIAADEARLVACSMVVERPVRSRSETTFRFRPDRGGTLATWRMTMQPTRATRLLLGLSASLDAVAGSQFDEGLRRLGARAEADVVALHEAA